MNSYKSGVLFAIGAFAIWGIFPFYWKALEHVGSMEVLMNRIIWSFILTTIFILIIGQGKAFLQDIQYLRKHKKHLLFLFLAAVVVSINWLVYIWSVQQGQVLQSSLAYYINPILSVVCGIIFFKEKLSKALTISVILATIGVLYMILAVGVFPWPALLMATSFAIYGVLKKKIPLDALRGLALETMLIFPLAIIYYGYLFTSTETAFLQVNFSTDFLLIFSGIATAVPLIFFAKGARSIPLYLVGFIQFLTPTMTFIVSIYVYHEVFTIAHFITFSFIWLAIIIFSSSSYLEARKVRKTLLATTTKL